MKVLQSLFLILILTGINLVPAFSESKNKDKSSFNMIWEDKTEPALLPFPLQISLLRMSGDTKVTIFDSDDNSIADGEGKFTQYLAMLSYEPVQTDWYITPEIGYFQRTVTVKDFSYRVDEMNSDTDGFIPGVITDPDTLEVIPKDTVSSLAYKAKFQSVFLDIKAGLHLAFEDRRGTRFIFNPYISGSLVEYRKTTFEFEIMQRTRKFTRSYRFSYFDSYGAGCDVGMYFSWARTGIKIGYDKRYLRKIELPEDIKFKEVYKEDGLYKTREVTARYTKLEADLVTLTIFFNL